MLEHKVEPLRAYGFGRLPVNMILVKYRRRTYSPGKSYGVWAGIVVFQDRLFSLERSTRDEAIAAVVEQLESEGIPLSKSIAIATDASEL